MATVVWSKQAHNERDWLYFNGKIEFGTTVANKTARIIQNIEKDLEKWPTSGFPEPLLKDLVPFYRSRHINKRFKIVYWYDEGNDQVVIEDIWDTRRNPHTLTQRITRQ